MLVVTRPDSGEVIGLYLITVLEPLTTTLQTCKDQYITISFNYTTDTYYYYSDCDINYWNSRTYFNVDGCSITQNQMNLVYNTVGEHTLIIYDGDLNKIDSYSITVLDHEWDNGTVIQEPTCTENGIMKYICQNCGTEKEDDSVLTALGHDFPVQWTVIAKATLENSGLEQQVCTRCGDIVTRSIPKLTGKWKSDTLGTWFEYSDGNYPRDCWYFIENHWYHFNKKGYRDAGWIKLKNAWYFLDESTGIMKNGWQYVDKCWYYFNNDGVMQTGWIFTDNNWYYLKSNGKMAASGWEYINNAWYFFKTNGTMQMKWLNFENYWYYLGSNGKMVTSGLQSINGSWYCFNASGKMQTGWQKLNGTWYYFKADGKMAVNGWQKIGGKWYYMDKNGAMQESRWISGTYYVKADGSMAVSEWVDQDRYYVDANGKWVKNKVKEA